MLIAKFTVRLGGHEVCVTDCSDEDHEVVTLMGMATSATAVITIEVPQSPEAAAVLGRLVFRPKAAPAHPGSVTDKIPVLSTRLDTLGFSVRLEKAFDSAGLIYVWQVVEKSASEISKIKNIGDKSIANINEKVLRALGLTWRMDLSSIKDQLPR